MDDAVKLAATVGMWSIAACFVCLAIVVVTLTVSWLWSCFTEEKRNANYPQR